MYIVKKTILGKDYYYLRKSIRKGDKVISKNIAYLGKDRKEAEKKAKKIVEELKGGKSISDKNKPFKKVMTQGIESSEDEKNKINEKKPSKLVRKELTIDELANFCKKKGFVFRSSDIYGGFSGFWDFGGLGVELFNNIKQNWWDYFVKTRDNMVGIEASVISHPRTWKASGHIESFNVSDFLITCKKCKKSSKVDRPSLKKVKCECGGDYDWDKAQMIEQMFKTQVGAVDRVDAYLRGETAQSMFMDFKLVQQTSRKQLPFGIAQIGRCFRNEIAPRDFLFRSREFHIGELEFFINPEETKCDLLMNIHRNIKLKLLDVETQKKGKEELRVTSIGKMLKEKRLGEWNAYWLAEQILWFNSIGLSEIKIREHTKDELSHYSSATFDIDYEYSFGSEEIAAIANRGQYDLTQHEKESKQDMSIYDEETGKKVIPRVIEPTFGIERVFLAILTKAYCYDKARDYVVLKIPAKLAPIKAAVFPVVRNNEELVGIAEEIYEDLKNDWNVVYDVSGAIGRRYARVDEVGVPLAITVDKQSLKDKTITLRDRDSTKQVRVKIKGLRGIISRVIGGEIEFEKAGKLVETRKK